MFVSGFEKLLTLDENGYGFQMGPSKNKETTRNHQVILHHPTSPVQKYLTSNSGFNKLEYRIKSVQNAILWTRLRFSGGAMKEERGNQKFLR